MTVDIHTIVYHNLYGEGEVVKLTDENVYVSFGGKQRIFPYPDAFEKGFLLTDIVITKTEETPVNEIVELTPEDIRHHIMVIKVNQLYEENMDSNALYSIVRGIWKAAIERARKAEYVFGVYQSRIVGVYKPTEWHICKEAKDILPRKDIILSPENENRIFFVDTSFEQGLPRDENQEFYLGKSIARLTRNKNAQNPISYLDPKVTDGKMKPSKKQETTELFREMASEYNVLDHSKSDKSHDRSYLGKEGSQKALFLACSRVGKICVYFDKSEKPLLDNNGFTCEVNPSSGWDYRTYVDSKDFEAFLKLVQSHLGR